MCAEIVAAKIIPEIQWTLAAVIAKVSDLGMNGIFCVNGHQIDAKPTSSVLSSPKLATQKWPHTTPNALSQRRTFQRGVRDEVVQVAVAISPKSRATLQEKGP